MSDTILHTLPTAPVEKAQKMCASEKGSPWLIVAGGFHRDGGMDKANLALAEYLVERGTRVHLVCHHIDPDFSRHQLVTLHSVGRPAGSFFLGEPLLDMRARAVARSLQVKWPNLPVIVNGGNCLWPGINWVHYVHHAWKPGWRSTPAWFGVKQALTEWVIRRRERHALRRAKLLIANSERTAQHLVEYFGIDARRIRTVYLGGESEWRAVTAEERAASRNALQLPPARPIAVFVGGLGYDDRKGFDVLFEAWRRLCVRPDWDVDLLVAGSGNALSMWQRRTSESGLAARIRLLGFLQEIPGLLAAADLLVSPVRYEAYGLNVQEAICRGIPAMVSQCAGVGEKYPPEFTPLLIPNPDDVDALVKRLLAWRSRKEEWIKRFQSFGNVLRSRSWRDMASDMVSLIEEQQLRDSE